MSTFVPPIAIAFLSAFCFSCLEADVGYLTNILNIPSLQIVLIRNTTACLLCLAYLKYNHTPEAPFGPPKLIGLNIIGGLGIATGLIVGYTAMAYLTISEYTTVWCLLPFATAFYCRIFVNERFTLVQAVCCLTSLLGVGLVTDPFGHLSGDDKATMAGVTDDHLPDTLVSKIIGVAICIPALFGSAAGYVVFRIIKGRADTTQITMYMSLCPAFSAAMLAAATRTNLVVPDGSLGWVLLLCVVPLGLTGQYTMTWATQRISGTQVAIAHNSSVAFSALLQWAIYDNHPSLTAGLGMVIIVGSGLYASVYGAEDVRTREREVGAGEVETLLLPREEAERADLLGTQ